jgi:hypothetical protein
LNEASTEGRIASVTRHPLLILLVAIGLAASAFPEGASAHRGHAPAAESTRPPDPAAHHGPAGPSPTEPAARHAAAVALAAGALALLASLPRRQRTLAFALAALLALAAGEGATHAALHLGHVPHTDSLAIGASPGLQAVADLDPVPVATPPLAVRQETLPPEVAPATGITITANHGRAPPCRPA